MQEKRSFKACYFVLTRFELAARYSQFAFVLTRFELAARYSQFANANSHFANVKSSILRMAFCKNNVSKVDFHNHFECILL
jgi:hypothetical protein